MSEVHYDRDVQRQEQKERDARTPHHDPHSRPWSFDISGRCIVCASDRIMKFWRALPENVRVHCNDCGSDIPIHVHKERQKK